MKKTLKVLFLMLVIALIYAPIMILAVYSFTDSTNIGAIHEFSLQNYINLFTNEELRSMIFGTLFLALGSAVISTVLGTLGALGAFYSKKRIKNAMGTLNQVPVVNADVVTGFSICILLIVVLGVDKATFIPLIIGHVVLSVPFVYLAVVPKLKQMDGSLYEAAMDLGASPSTALKKVVFPQISSGVVSGFALAVTLSLDDYFISTYTKPATFDTISTYVVNATKGSQTETKTALWALSTIIFVGVILIVIGMNVNNARKMRKTVMSLVLVCSFAFSSGAFTTEAEAATEKDDEEIVLRVCNWEEYIDLGDWDEEERIELENGVEIFGENSMVDDFCRWYKETYGKTVRVEYSCFGTNEELYSQLTLGDTYDLVCPSDYMIMKLIAENEVEPLSDDFFDENDEHNYYIKGVSPYIKEIFEENTINGESWSRYAAGYMWGVTGVLYNPEYVTDEEASTWSIFSNDKFKRQITLKDNVRDTYFAALGILKADKLMDSEFINNENYETLLAEEMNDVSTDTINEVEVLLQDIMGNIYALETDSGKADMITGKIKANYQWSGDAVYAMDQAEEDGVFLKFAAPKECTNLFFDGWVMLKEGIDGDSDKKHAAEAFINYLSMPENAVRNMYYIGYTSVMAGEDDTIFNYLDYSYGAEEDTDEEELVEYPVGFFFTGDADDEDYVITTVNEQIGRQLYAQYPSADILNRSAIMGYYDDASNKEINQMWINIRCYNIKDVPVVIWIIVGVLIISIVALAVRKKLSSK